MADFSFLSGKTITEIQKVEGWESNDKIVFEFDDDSEMIMTHKQECCENVYLAEVIGDFEDLLNTPILVAYASCSVEHGDSCEDDEKHWTFYRISTIKGTVTLRWCGTSNGYYSVSVDVSYRPVKGPEINLTT